MATQAPATVYQDLLDAGFTPAAAVTMTEIAGAESGYNDRALGDIGLESNTWGPSVGLFQIRTEKSATGTGSDRDITALTGDVAAQARAAYQISDGGQNFAAWTTWTSGKYQEFAATVRNALGLTVTSSPPATTVDTGTGAVPPLPTVGPNWLPWNWPSDVGNAAAQAAQSEVSSVRTVVVEALFAAAGIALIGLGVVGLTKTRLKGVTGKIDQAGRAVAGAAR